jgi:hypothetical protein
MRKPTPNPNSAPPNPQSEIGAPAIAGHPQSSPPDLYQIIIECKAESQQRELFERLRREGFKVRLLVL